MSTPKNQLAVALQYEAPGTPRVVAKGKGEIGQKIIDTARQHGVPIEENASLAGALSEVEIGDEIPVELYKAVAEVLIFLMKMSGVRPGAKAAAKPGAAFATPTSQSRQPQAAPPPASANIRR
jgi:flagellar biosynthesis protein